MKQSLSLLLGFAVVLCCIPVFALTNLVQNPGFELGVVSWRPGGGTGATIDTDPHSGAKSLKMVPNTNEHTILYQNIPVTAGKVYTISAWIKQEGNAGPGSDASSYVYYMYLAAGGSKVLSSGYIKYIHTGTTTYTLTKNYSLAPDSAVTMQLHLRSVNPMSGYQTTGHFDDVSVVEGEYMTNKVNVLNNPGFESGTAGWSGINSNVTASTERPRSGTYSLRIHNAGAYATVTQSVSVVEGEGIGFSGYACVRAPTGDSAVLAAPGYGAFYYLSFTGPAYQDVMDMDAGNHASYFRSSHEVIVPPGKTTFWIQCWVFQGGPYVGYFDDVKLIKFARNPNPPGIKPLTISIAKRGADVHHSTYDILGRQIAGSMAKISVRNLRERTANGVYFTFDKESQAPLRTANMDGN